VRGGDILNGGLFGRRSSFGELMHCVTGRSTKRDILLQAHDRS
jgi:hypothetical protein